MKLQQQEEPKTASVLIRRGVKIGGTNYQPAGEGEEAVIVHDVPLQIAREMQSAQKVDILPAEEAGTGKKKGK